MSRLIILVTIAAVTLGPASARACDEPGPPRFDGDPQAGVSVSVGRIADRTWEPRVIDGQGVPAGSGLSLSVGSDGTVAGSTGCNRFTGTAEMDAGELTLGPLVVTEMACADPSAMERESAWLKALGEVRWFVVTPQGLWLSREDGTVAVCLR